MPVKGIDLKEGQIWEDNVPIQRTIKRNPSGSVDFPWIGENTEGGGYNTLTNDGRFNGVDYSYYDLNKLIYNPESEENSADKKEEVKEEPRYNLQDIKEAWDASGWVVATSSWNTFQENITKINSPEYKEYLRLKAIYE